MNSPSAQEIIPVYFLSLRVLSPIRARYNQTVVLIPEIRLNPGQASESTPTGQDKFDDLPPKE